MAATALCASVGAQTQWTYPPAHTVDQVDVYHGVKVADPYRWLEDPDATDSQ